MVSTLALAFVAVFLLSAAVFARSLKRALASPRPTGPSAADPDHALVARPIVDEQGQPAGETVRVEGAEVVFKKDGKFYVVSKYHLTDYGTSLFIDSIDWAEAERRGEAWRAAQEDRLPPDDGTPDRAAR